MSQKLHIRAFFFNAKTDYLPYYKNFTVNLEDASTAKELLARIQEQNENFNYPKQKLIMKINGLVVEGKEKLSNIVDRLGTELTIDPVNSYRSMHGLKIKDDDFMNSFSLLEPYATEADLKYYKTLYPLHYASETENFDRSYIGDAILVLAHKMITEGSEHKAEILDAITSANSGLLDCEYENNLFNAEDHEAAITALKEMAKSDEDEHPSLFEMIKSRFCKEKEEKVVQKSSRKVKKIDGIEQKQIAYYAGGHSENENVISQMLVDMGIKEIQLDRKYKRCGKSIIDDNRTLALKKAGAILLDAYDKGAQVLVVEDERCYELFEDNFSAIEKVTGRELLGFELLLAEDFVTNINTLAA